MRVEIILQEEDSGDCEYGCWNTGYGVLIRVDGKKRYEQPAWATCCNNSSIDWEDVYVFVTITLGIQNASSISWVGFEPEDIPDWFA